jgi:pimeloyl-ACP methyl ester carboxylesterase
MAYAQWGARDNPRVLLCVHGMSRNGSDFSQLARALAADYRVVCPDLVGRGRSDWLRDPAGYSIAQYVADLLVLIARLDVERVDWLGTSLGGLIGMALASLDGAPVARLVLNDVGPLIAGEALARIGDYLGRAPKFASVADAESYIRQVSAPFGALSDESWRQLTESSLRRCADGRFEMRYDPAIAQSFRLAVGADLDLWPIYDRISCPTLLVRGELSDLLSAATAQAMAVRGPRPQVVCVPGVGHAPMFMDESQIAIVSDFLRAA